MGQYFTGVILREEKPIVALSSYVLHEGAKLMEQASFSSPYIKFWEQLLSNEFYGDNFIWCGDYSEGDLYKNARDIQKECAEKYATLIEDINNGNVGREHRYIVNITKKQYVDMSKCENDIHPLPILCSNSNGMGGGDYYGQNMEIVGTWAEDKIGITNECPDTFTEVLPNFNEDF